MRDIDGASPEMLISGELSSPYKVESDYLS